MAKSPAYCVHHRVDYDLNLVTAVAKATPLQNGFADDLPIKFCILV